MAKRNLFIGIDSGTQSTKVLIVDGRSGKVLSEASQSYGLIEGLPPGAKEQHPHTWKEAAGNSMRKALKLAGASKEEVKA
ncbi:MAG TPA: xylulokinase, partial [Verrucomicrobiales bacterium]|nr:xylulokinase [Verrucomicrobiales bacterium]